MLGPSAATNYLPSLTAPPEVEDCFAAESSYSEAADCPVAAAYLCRPEVASLNCLGSGSADSRAGSAKLQASGYSDSPAAAAFPEVFPAAGPASAGWFPADPVGWFAACCRRAAAALFLNPAWLPYWAVGCSAPLRRFHRNLRSRRIHPTLPSRLAQRPSRSLRALRLRYWELPTPRVLPLLKGLSNGMSSHHTSKLACRCHERAAPRVSDHSGG